MMFSLLKGLLHLFPVLVFYYFQAENKVENESDEGDKIQDGENEKSSEKEQDSEVSEDIKPGDLGQSFWERVSLGLTDSEEVLVIGVEIPCS